MSWIAFFLEYFEKSGADFGELFRILFSGMFYNQTNNRKGMLWEEEFFKGKEVAGISGGSLFMLGDYG